LGVNHGENKDTAYPERYRDSAQTAGYGTVSGITENRVIYGAGGESRDSRDAQGSFPFGGGGGSAKRLMVDCGAVFLKNREE
jgi:hypothetical protein